MTATVKNGHASRVDERFKTADLQEPVTSALYALALEKEQTLQASESFADIVQAPMPDPAQYLKMKQKISLLPLNVLKERIKLPSPPGVIFQLEDAIREGASSEKLATMIGADPKLTAAVMSMVNSPLYARGLKIETLSRAITVIGTMQISSLALGIRVAVMFEDTAPQIIPLEAFWKHSVACAVFAHEIAMACSRPEPEKYLVAGLLHDLGRVMLFSMYPDTAKVALAMHQTHGDSLNEAEKWLFDVDHGLVGGLFFGEWGLPRSVVQSAIYHHDPDQCWGKDVPEVVFVANQLATALGIGCDRTYCLPPGLAIWEKLGLGLDVLRPMVMEADHKLWAMFRSMFEPRNNNRR